MKKKTQLVIAKRKLELYGVNKKSILIKIFKPKRAKVDYICEYSYEGIKDKKIVNRAYGVDSFQSLILAIQKISGDIEYYNAELFDGKLRWLDDSSTDLGFSLSPLNYLKPKNKP